MTVWTRWLLLRVTPELVAEVKTDQKEMGNGSSSAKEQFWQKSIRFGSHCLKWAAEEKCPELMIPHVTACHSDL